MSGPELVALASLAAVLGFAALRPRGLPEIVAAAPAAALVLLVGAVPLADGWAELRRLLPVVGFLVAVLVLGHACDEEGLFAAIGDRLAGARMRRRPDRLLPTVFVIAALTTAVLSLDATVVLLTPVVLAAARRLRVPARPPATATAHLANSASLLLPVSNLTNLLALGATGLTFAGFTARMGLPWLAAIAVEYAVLARWFRADLVGRRAPAGPNAIAPDPAAPAPAGPDPAAAGPDPTSTPAARPLPWLALGVLAAVLVGFVVAEPLGIAPAWVAAAGAAVLVTHGMTRGRLRARAVLHAASPGFVAFVLALGVVVAAVENGGLGHLLAHLVPHGSSLADLAWTAVLAALLANLVNNLPATLLLVPIAAAAGPAGVLAVLLGVNLGPNASYPGSLATLLWRRVLLRGGEAVSAGDFHRLGAVTVPLTLAAAVLALWLSMRLLGG